MDNKTIAKILDEMGNILEIKGADTFRVNAYKKAAQNIELSPHDLRKAVEKAPHDLPKISGVGDALEEKIVELVQTGRCKEHEKLKKSFPDGLLEMLNLRGVGPKKVKMFYHRLKISSLADLKKAAEEHKLRELEGMGAKSEEDILKALDEYAKFSSKRHLIHNALREAENYIEHMKKCNYVNRIEYAGSLRRWKETIGDIDILVTVKNPSEEGEKVMKHFLGYEEVLDVVAEGNTKSTAVLESGMSVDLRVLDESEFGAALHYFTGNKSHNIKIRNLAKKKGLKISEYGVFKGDKKIAGEKEEEIFESVGLPYIIPELRKNDGEIEYAQKHKKFPKFVELKDIKGDIHTHSNYSDGECSIEEMAEAFMKRGYEYFAVTDHSSLVGVTGGMGTKDIRKQWEGIDKLNKKLKGKIKILKGCEVDILKDGSLDFSDDVLKKLDVVVVSAHLYSKLSPAEQTKRLISAIENPYSKILGHPTGRLLGRRGEMEFDMEKVVDACIENNVYLEINSHPMRLDLPDKYIKIAKEKGAKFAINTDSHNLRNTEFIKFGVGMARRGWLEPKDVINTLPIKKFDTEF